jgi:hypothetical protein
MARLAVIIILLNLSFAFAGEVEECRRLAPKYNARAEVRLWDMSRVDLLSEEYAIEVDYSHKWSEAVGQSLYYSLVTEKKPAIVLLVTNPQKESRFIFRLQAVCAKHGIKLFLEQLPNSELEDQEGP